MSEKLKEFFEMMLEFFPFRNDDYQKEIEDYYEGKDTIIIEDIFMPDIIKLLETNGDIKLLERIFKYFENVSNCEDDYLINVFSITALEILGNDKKILEAAKSYMGPKTTQLQIKADKDLGRMV